MATHYLQKTIPLSSISISIEDVAKIFEKLVLQIQEQAEIEISKFVKPADKTDEQFAAEKSDVRNRAFRVTVTVSGRDGQSLFGDDVAMFHSPNLPDKISSIYMTNVTAYQNVGGRRPLNAFELNLDFSKPKLLDANNPVSSPTPNVSNLSVQGDRESWVASISDAVLSVTQSRKTNRSWIHGAFVYDLGLVVFGFPVALYACWKVSPFVSSRFGEIHPFLSGAAYVYVILFIVWAYRILFGYTKWAFPTIELTDNKDAARTHRAIWAAIILGLIGNAIWEIVTQK